MPRDYKSRANPPSQKRAPTPGWVWFVAGLLVGVFASGLTWLKLGPGLSLAGGKTAAATEQRTEAKPSKPAKEESSEVPKPRFDFYTLLPEMEVVVSDQDEKEGAREQPTTGETEAPAPVSDNASYVVQMGSFRRYEEADRLKASLALMGVEAEIQKVTVQSGDLFYRVLSRPLSRADANQLRARLQEQHINSLLVRMKS
jgi:cell division protein FtsN